MNVNRQQLAPMVFDKKYFLYQRRHIGNIIFIAFTKQQVREFMNIPHCRLKEIDDKNRIDFDLTKGHNRSLMECVPFAAQAEIRIGCHCLEKESYSRNVWGQEVTHDCYFCSNKYTRQQASQLDTSYAILKKCCGIFVPQFYKKLKNWKK